MGYRRSPRQIPRTAAGLIEVLPGIGDSGRIVLGDPPEAIEVELSDKSNRRLDEILKGWRWTVAEKKVSRVRYLCAPKALPYVERAIEPSGRCRMIVDGNEQGQKEAAAEGPAKGRRAGNPGALARRVAPEGPR